METLANGTRDRALSFDAHRADEPEAHEDAIEEHADEQAEGAEETTPARKALRALGLENPGTRPTAETPLADVLLYALTPYGGERPERGMVLSVAAELETLAMFIDGPLSISLDMMARRLRASMDLASRLHESAAA